MNQKSFLSNSYRDPSPTPELTTTTDDPPPPNYIPGKPLKNSWFEPPPPRYVPAPPPNISPLERYGVPPRILSLGSKSECRGCKKKFIEGALKRNCGACGNVFCAVCTMAKTPYPQKYGYNGPQRVCARCLPKLITTVLQEGSDQKEIELSGEGNSSTSSSDADILTFL